MANKFNFFILGLLCLTATYHAAPAPDSSQESSEEMNMKGFIERLKLISLTLTEFTTLYDDILQKAPNIFREVLKDPKVTEVQTEAMQSQTKIMQDYLCKFEKVKKENDKGNTFELVDKYDDVVTKFDSNQHDLTPEAAIIEKSLEKHGIENFT